MGRRKGQPMTEKAKISAMANLAKAQAKRSELMKMRKQLEDVYESDDSEDEIIRVKPKEPETKPPPEQIPDPELKPEPEPEPEPKQKITKQEPPIFDLNPIFERFSQLEQQNKRLEEIFLKKEQEYKNEIINTKKKAIERLTQSQLLKF